jgi:cytochrome c-type biogenesis protein CcmH
MKARILVVVTFLMLMLATAANMATAASGVDKKLEEKATSIEGQLMAPCCWSSTISQHYSETADEIRRDIRTMLGMGKSEREILDYYVSVYGERILASPSARGFNLLAWLLPGIFFTGCALFVLLLLRRWTASRTVKAEAGSSVEPIDESYMRRLEKELKEFE